MRGKLPTIENHRGRPRQRNETPGDHKDPYQVKEDKDFHRKRKGETAEPVREAGGGEPTQGNVKRRMSSKLLPRRRGEI